MSTKGLLNFCLSADQKKRKRLEKVPQTPGTLTKTTRIKTNQQGHCNDLRMKERRKIEKQDKEKNWNTAESILQDVCKPGATVLRSRKQLCFYHN